MKQKVQVRTERYLRCVGYYAKESSLNEGKRQEFADRQPFVS
ncbi:hypothetical protein [Anaeroselena agilis]|uniref:Uncharacterized protein n=1 Tax=Anaeroselena agilis TaxID=3063788 RepID=A0ABU3NVT0_9FIRM|nr:hypothetical protein [Selenomonadales bacterium 4137-cl]